MDWYVKVLKQYFDFSGRARRKEYWMFGLISAVISIVLTLLDMGVGLYSDVYGAGVLSSIYSLAIMIPSIAVSVRRLHDTDHSGWWLLLIFIPLLGVLILMPRKKHSHGLCFFVCFYQSLLTTTIAWIN